MPVRITVKAASKWPTTEDRRSWLLCTAAWASLATDEERTSAHFVFERFLERRALEDAALVLSWVSRSPRDEELSWLADQYLTLGDVPNAMKSLTTLLDRADGMPRKSDREYFTRQVLDRVAPGAKAPKKVELLAAFTRERLEAPGVKMKRPPLPPREVRSSASELRGHALEAVARAKRALRGLTDEDLNVHGVAGDIGSAVEAACAVKQSEEARPLFTAAMSRWNTGVFDGHGFASGWAWVSLGRAAFVLDGADAARPMLERADAVAGKHAQLIRAELAKAWALVGDVERALALAAKSEKSSRLKTTADVLRGAGRWRDLSAFLKSVTEPDEAAGLAWSLTYDIDR